MNALEVLNWMIEQKRCICGGNLEEKEDGSLQCNKCGLVLK